MRIGEIELKTTVEEVTELMKQLAETAKEDKLELAEAVYGAVDGHSAREQKIFLAGIILGAELCKLRLMESITPIPQNVTGEDAGLAMTWAEKEREVERLQAIEAAARQMLPYLTDENEMLDYASLNDGRASEYDVASVALLKALTAARAALDDRERGGAGDGK